jgi:hypothetical protein
VGKTDMLLLAFTQKCLACSVIALFWRGVGKEGKTILSHEKNQKPKRKRSKTT